MLMLLVLIYYYFNNLKIFNFNYENHLLFIKNRFNF